MSETYPQFVCTYIFEGVEYGVTIPARDAQEASRRLRAIGMTANVDGELINVIPAYPGVGLYVRAVTMFRNVFWRR